MQILSERRIPIAIVGLENAGKTTLSVRLQTGRYHQTLPTAGLDVEVVDVKGTLFQLFDLGGHQHFRELFWRNYVQLSQGIIFVIDSSDCEKLDEVVDWLWKCLEWNKNAPLLILANKSDLKHIEFEDLIRKIRLAKLPIQNPHRSFRIFEVSMKLGTNLDEAFSWFSQKTSNIIDGSQIKLLGLYIYLPTGIPIASHLFTKEPSQNLDVDMIPGFLNAIDQFTSGFMGPNEGLQSLNTQNHCILMVKREGVLCALITAKDSDPGVTRVVAESILTYLETSFAEKLSLFRKDGKIRFPKNFILDFLEREFSKTVIIN
ncbi:MAG: GTP-binding protein [Candidatus Heimdallarchaeota archaeon]|nr:MAG: GTP-binding protein [Candidatus Heimdallarchaeota archaeon]